MGTMKIKKIGHCCLILDIDGRRVMTDPGSYTIDEQIQEKNIDLVVITHEHADHLHIESLKDILSKNQSAIVVTNISVGKLLGEAGIAHQILEDKGVGEFAGVYLEAHGDKHAEIYEDISMVQNTGYFIGKDFFYPGDAFINPRKPVDILALPVAGPWTTIKDSILYAKELKPRLCFPVHDWNMKLPGVAHRTPAIVLPKHSIEFHVLQEGKEEEL
jgi:L-ascorbate metabolism protein UlaG (beta-lactamase superfamily)